MRLTLRNLLAYLNDELSAEQTRELGPRIAASEPAQQMIEKLQSLLRRRRLSAPDIHLGDERSPQEPNYVSAYIDCELTEEEQAVFEAMCLENDVHLAEVAACLSLKTLGDQASIRVPPTALRRMYQLVKGREAVPDRQPPKPKEKLGVAAERSVDGVAEDEEEALLLLDPLYQQVRRKWSGRLAPLAAAFLAVLVGGMLYWLSQMQPETSPFAASAPADGGLSQANQKPALTPEETRQVVREGSRPEALVGRLAGFAAARPALPPNFLLALGHETQALAEGATGERPAAEPAAAERPATDVPPPIPDQPPPVEMKEPTPKDAPPAEPPPPPPVVKVAAGQYDSDPAKDGPLFRLAGPSDWRPTPAQASVLTGEPLLTLPGMRAELTLANGLRLALCGAQPGEAAPKQGLPFAEASCLLSKNAEADAELTLEAGRFLLSRKGDGLAKVKLRFRDADWLVTILHPETEVSLEASGRLAPGAENPDGRFALAVQKGIIEVERGGKKETLREKQGLVWDSQDPDPAGLGTVREVAMPWVSKKPILAPDVRDGQAAFQKRLNERLAQAGPSLPWIKVACDEALLSRRPTEQQLALQSLAAFGQFGQLVGALDDPERPAVRRAAWEALTQAMGRTPGQLERLRQALLARGWSDADAALVVELARGSAQGVKPSVEKLLAVMQRPRLALREMAFASLQQLVPLERPNFDPAGGLEAREKALEALRKKLLQ